MSNPLNHLGDVVAVALDRAGVSENQAALNSGISRETLRRRLRGGNFTVQELGAIARVLNVPASDLLAQSERAA